MKSLSLSQVHVQSKSQGQGKSGATGKLKFMWKVAVKMVYVPLPSTNACVNEKKKSGIF